MTTIPRGLLNVKLIEPPCTERYARWCERSANQLMISLLLDLPGGIGGKEVRIFALLSRREKALQLTKNLLTKSSTKRFREYIKRKEIKNKKSLKNPLTK